jgi:hypothetical protein
MYCRVLIVGKNFWIGVSLLVVAAILARDVFKIGKKVRL